MQKLSLKVLLRFLSVYSHWNLGDNNYCSHRIIDSFQRIVKLQFCWPQEDVASVQQNRNTCFYFSITRGKFSIIVYLRNFKREECPKTGKIQ